MISAAELTRALFEIRKREQGCYCILRANGEDMVVRQRVDSHFQLSLSKTQGKGDR
jgi:hypothetical protein